MKKKLAIITAFIALALTASAETILTVNMGQLYEGYWKAQDAQDKFNSAVQTAQEEIQKMAKDGETLVTQINKLQEEINSPAISADRKKELQGQAQDVAKKIQQKQQEIQKFRQEQDKTLAQRRQTIINYNLQNIRETVAGIAETKQADLVLNTDGLAVIYSKDGADITNEVLTKLNADKPADKAPAKKK